MGGWLRRGQQWARSREWKGRVTVLSVGGEGKKDVKDSM